MRKKIPSISLITLIVLVTASMCLAGEPDRFEQAGEHENSRDYEQAEQVYLNILEESTQTDDALQALERLTCLYITWNKRPEADAALRQLLDGFSQQQGAPAAVANVADAYQALGRHKKACELYNYFLETWPEGEQAMWSQMSLTISNIALGNDSETQECVETLLTDFSGDERLAGTLNDIADACRELWKFEKRPASFINTL